MLSNQCARGERRAFLWSPSNYKQHLIPPHTHTPPHIPHTLVWQHWKIRELENGWHSTYGFYLIIGICTVVRHVSSSEGLSRAFRTPISFADANLKESSWTFPSRDEGFKRLEGAPGMGQKFENAWSHNFLEIFLKFSWNFPELVLAG